MTVITLTEENITQKILASNYAYFRLLRMNASVENLCLRVLEWMYVAAYEVWLTAAEVTEVFVHRIRRGYLS